MPLMKSRILFPVSICGLALAAESLNTELHARSKLITEPQVQKKKKNTHASLSLYLSSVFINNHHCVDHLKLSTPHISFLCRREFGLTWWCMCTIYIWPYTYMTWPWIDAFYQVVDRHMASAYRFCRCRWCMQWMMGTHAYRRRPPTYCFSGRKKNT